MYGIPDNFPHGLLRGAVLEQVCVGLHDVQFRFDGDVTISVSSSVRVDEKGLFVADFAAIAASLCGFLGKSITEAKTPRPKVLRLAFGDHSLEIFDDSDEFESFTVRIGGTEIVV
jgi:hypothetical protein